MEIIVAALNTINGSGGASFLISLSALVIGSFLYFKKTNIENITSVGAMQQANVNSLLAQIQVLSDELTKARKQLAEIHEQNIHLMEQVRDSNRRIQELEQMLEHNRSN